MLATRAMRPGMRQGLPARVAPDDHVAETAKEQTERESGKREDPIRSEQTYLLQWGSVDSRVSLA